MPHWCLGSALSPASVLAGGLRVPFRSTWGVPRAWGCPGSWAAGSVVCRLRRACRPLTGRAAVLGCLETGGSASSSLTVLYVGVNQEGFRERKKKSQVDTTQASFSLCRLSGLCKLFHDAAVKASESCLCCQSPQMLLVSAARDKPCACQHCPGFMVPSHSAPPAEQT